MSRTRTIKAAVMALPLLVLSACFGTEGELIPAGEAVLPIDQAMTLCEQDGSQCTDFIASGDAYINVVGGDAASQQDAVRLRFSGLGQIDGRQIYIIEMSSQKEDDPGTLIGVARKIHVNAEAVGDMETAVLECGDLDDDASAEFTALGGEIDAGHYVTTCAPSDLTMLKSFLRNVMWEEMASADWWTEHGFD